MRMKNAFTLLELVFVIVVIGILSVVAVPKLAPLMGDAKMAKARDTLSAVRSALAIERQKRILRGEFTHISDLGDSTYAFSNFDNNSSNPILEYPVENCSSSTSTSCWIRDGSVSPKTFTYRFSGSGDAIYKLENSRLVCNDTADDCKKLLK